MPTTYTSALQHVEPFPSADDATAALETMLLQVGALGGRVLPAANGEPDRLQMFYENDLPADAILPDGMRRVLVPSSLFDHLRLPERSGERRSTCAI